MIRLVVLLLIAVAGADSDRGWPGLKVAADGAELYKALGQRTLHGRDAASVFLALLRPGQYRVRTAYREFDLKLSAEPGDRNEVDLRLVLGYSGAETGRTFVVHTGERPSTDPGYARPDLRTFDAAGSPTVRLGLTNDLGATVLRVRFTRGLTRLLALSVSGPLLERFRELVPEYLVGTPIDFTFVEWSPPHGLELDCRKLLRRLAE